MSQVTERQIHLTHLEDLFSTLAANGLAIISEKCVFAVPTLEIMGHHLGARQVRPQWPDTLP